MSFQGDVAGIGLGELLQGLSRGGRDGVLTLYGDEATACIGLHRGQLYFLASPDEQEDTWRERSMAAFVDDPDPNCESQRREAIARASRLETVYRMLEAPGLHFRFEQGPLPLPPNYQPPTTSTVSIDGSMELPAFDPAHSPWGRGITVEYLLLENARMCDEASSGVAATLSGFDIPRSLDTASEPDPGTRDFLSQCTGTSTIQEIADRLGWPVSQCRNTVAQFVEAGHLRIAAPRELLAGAQRELELGRISRAAVRLAGWVESAPPGPPPPGDAELLVGEWEAGRLAHILHALPAPQARALLRKLDHAHGDARASRERWRSLQEAFGSDSITWLHATALRLVATEEPEARTFHDLLTLARQFQEKGFEQRTRTLLRLASGHLPSRPRVRIELGRRMMESGLEEEGTRWLLDAAHALIEAGNPADALAPIRYVLRARPGHGEAGSLEVHAQTLCANRKKRKVVFAVGISLGVIGALAALVQYRRIRKVEDWLVQVQAYVGEPEVALEKLHEAFGDDPPQRIAEARERLIALERESRRRALEEWREGYQDAEDASRLGDPLLGLRRTLDLVPPPGTPDGAESFDARQDLLGILADRLGKQSEALDKTAATMSVEELNAEQRLIDLLEAMLEEIPEAGAAPEVGNFRFHLAELHQSILERREARAEERALLSAKEQDQKADILLATARAHATAGDLDRALSAYERLLASDESLRSLPALAEEIEGVKRHRDGWKRALELAEQGEHEAAAETLLEVCPRPIEHLLPFHVRTHPEGCRVTGSDGRVRTTPFVAKSAIGEVLEFRFELDGFRTQEVRLDRPRDLELDLAREPDLAWDSGERIEALPVPAGADHIVADRTGTLRRLARGGEVRWETKLVTLGGIARTPVFLPERPGHLLVLSEDGQVWILDAATGRAEGPREIGSPPVDGPALTRGGITASFADKRVAVWNEGLEPVFYEDDAIVSTDAEPVASDSGLAVLRRAANSPDALTSPWNGWRIEVRSDGYRVLAEDGKGFTVERHGDWIYLAWEAPKAFVPNGRLWVSDEGGLRSFTPTFEQLVEFED